MFKYKNLGFTQPHFKKSGVRFTQVPSFRLKSGAGFTLVELLVVIAIIGILSSVALINMQSARDKAKKTLVLSELSQAVSAIQTCFADEQNLIPPVAGANPAYSVGGTSLCTGSSATWPVVNRDGLDYYYFIAGTTGIYNDAISDTGRFTIMISEGTPFSFGFNDVRLYCASPMVFDAMLGQDDVCEIYKP